MDIAFLSTYYVPNTMLGALFYWVSKELQNQGDTMIPMELMKTLARKRGVCTWVWWVSKSTAAFTEAMEEDGRNGFPTLRKYLTEDGLWWSDFS